MITGEEQWAATAAAATAVAVARATEIGKDAVLVVRLLGDRQRPGAYLPAYCVTTLLQSVDMQLSSVAAGGGDRRTIQKLALLPESGRGKSVDSRINKETVFGKE